VVKVLHHAGMAKYPGSRWVFVAGYGRFWVLRCRTEGAEGAEKNEEEKGGKEQKEEGCCMAQAHGEHRVQNTGPPDPGDRSTS
jgi:hypothetical protein